MKLIDSADFYHQRCQEIASAKDHIPEFGRSPGLEAPVFADNHHKLDVGVIKEHAKARMEQIKLKPRYFRIMRFNIAKKLAMAVAECDALDVRIELGTVSGYITFTGRGIEHIGTDEKHKYLQSLLWLIKSADAIRLGCFELDSLPMLQIILTYNLHKVNIRNKREQELEQLLQ